MIETLNVSIAGPVLSFLLYENTKCKNGQEGFLLGKLIEHETKSITDNDHGQLTMTRIIKIESVIPCPNLHYFYDGIGKINQDKIRTFLGDDQVTKVVSWFKFKPTNSFKLTFREKNIHKQLIEFFDLRKKEFFSFCVLINEKSDNFSTHSYSQYFVRLNNNNYDQIPLHIVNLNDPSISKKVPEPASDTIKQIVEQLKCDQKQSQGGLTMITEIQNSLQKHVDSIVDELAKAEAYLYELENDVCKLKEIKSAGNSNGNVVVPNGDSNSSHENQTSLDANEPTAAAVESHENQTDLDVCGPATRSKAGAVINKSPSGKRKVTSSKKKI